MIARTIVAALAVAAPVCAQSEPPVRDRTLPTLQTTDDALARSRMYGTLVYTVLSVDHKATPARAAFKSLEADLRIPFIVRYADDPLGHGIDPETPIMLQMQSRPALEILEAMLAQCGTPTDPCTWQLRKAFVELGTKMRLSLAAARTTRLYDIVDLKMHIPEDPYDRAQPDIGALDVIQKICENVEPGVWDYGQTTGQEPATPGWSAPVSRAAETAPAPKPSAPGRAGRYVPPAKIAIIRYWRDVLIVHAPDYKHRQINGYPDPIRPDTPTPQR